MGNKKVIESVIWSRFILNLYVTFALFPQKYPTFILPIKIKIICLEKIPIILVGYFYKNFDFTGFFMVYKE